MTLTQQTVSQPDWLLVLTWSVLLAICAGLAIHPGLGAGARSSSGKTSTDLVTAIYVGGSSLPLSARAI